MYVPKIGNFTLFAHTNWLVRWYGTRPYQGAAGLAGVAPRYGQATLELYKTKHEHARFQRIRLVVPHASRSLFCRRTLHCSNLSWASSACRYARNLPSRQDLVEVPTNSSHGNFTLDESFYKAECASKEKSCLESFDFKDDIVSTDFGHLQTCE